MNKALNNLQSSTPVDTGYAQSRWRIQGNKITNDADYIRNLNDGTSKQAPAHFIERSILSIPGVKPNGNIIREK